MAHRPLVRRPGGLASLAVAAVVATIASTASAQFVISSATTTFTPSFRGNANTTYFGYGSGSFDGATDDSKIDNPTPTTGITAGVGLVQTDPAATIVSSTNNIYSGFGFPFGVLITTPTAGTPGTGFTTIIVQGKTAFSDFGSELVFGDVGGDAASVTLGLNKAGSGQFFAKYEIVGNAGSYVIPFSGGSMISLNSLQVDTRFSTTGFAADSAVAPEPTSIAALLGLGVLARRRRRAAK